MAPSENPQKLDRGALEDAVREAVQFHQAGELQRAKSLYERVLKFDSRHPTALHYAGILAFQTGDPELARAQIGAALKQDPDNPEIHSNLGLVLHEQGRTDEAVVHLERALALNPNYVDASMNLGVALESLGRLDEAITRYGHVLELAPQSPQAHFNLGNALQQQGAYREASESFRRAIALAPRFVEARVNLARAYLSLEDFAEAAEELGQALPLNPGAEEIVLLLADALMGADREDEAETLYRKALSSATAGAAVHIAYGEALAGWGRDAEAAAAVADGLNKKPADGELYRRAGRVLLRQSALAGALKAFDRALDIDSNDAHAHDGKGQVLMGMSRPDEAVENFRRAVAIWPEFVAAHCHLGRALRRSGRHDKALEAYAAAKAVDPADDGVDLGAAMVYRDLGDFDNAADRLQELLSNDPGHVGAFYELATSFPDRCTGETRARMAALFDDPSTAPEDGILLGYGLSAIARSKGASDEAFARLSRANDLHRDSYAYSIDDDRKVFAALARTVPSPAPAFAPPSQTSGATPIFIVGMPRSGTTLVEQILSRHRDVSAAGELTLLDRAIRDREQKKRIRFPDDAAAFDADDLSTMRAFYLDGLSNHAQGRAFVTDKMPHNFRHLGLIAKCLPEAPIVHVRRDPISTCLSLYETNFAAAHKYAQNLTELGAYYKMYAEFMAHCRRQVPESFLDLDYESLIREPETEIRNLLSYCGLAFDAACLHPEQSTQPVRTASTVQVRNPIHRSSEARWRAYEKHLGPLLAALDTAPPTG